MTSTQVLHRVDCPEWAKGNNQCTLPNRAGKCTRWSAPTLRDVAHLEDVIDRFPALGQTTTSTVSSPPNPLRAIDVAASRPS